jgi:hypothetical protein
LHEVWYPTLNAGEDSPGTINSSHILNDESAAIERDSGGIGSSGKVWNWLDGELLYLSNFDPIVDFTNDWTITFFTLPRLGGQDAHLGWGSGNAGFSALVRYTVQETTVVSTQWSLSSQCGGIPSVSFSPPVVGGFESQMTMVATRYRDSDRKVFLSTGNSGGVVHSIAINAFYFGEVANFSQIRCYGLAAMQKRWIK